MRWSTRASAGRRDAFDVIVQRNQRQVYQLCYRFVGNHEDASDLAQDVFIRAYRGLGGFKGKSALGDVAVPHRRQRLPEPRERQDAEARAAGRSADTADHRVERADRG